MTNVNSADFKIMQLPPERIRPLTPVTVLDVYESGTENFHENGLFSTSIFGRVGDTIRERKFSYIDCKIEVLHPLVFKNLLKLKRFYGEIIKGNAYAIFDEKEKDFIPSDIIDGDTGYNFFLQYWDKLEFKRNDSPRRNQYIDFIEKYKDTCKTKTILVLPAGLRDIEPDENGRDKEGEVNAFYRKILSIANTLSSETDLNTSITDNARLGIQNAFNSIYAYFIKLCKGKGGFILRKWARRKVFNATRSVLTAKVNEIKDINDGNHSGWNNTDVGIGQLCKAILPVAVHKFLTNDLVMDSFPADDNNAYLLNPKTFIRERVSLDNKTTDKWTTQSGVESLFDAFMEHSVRSNVIEIKGHYLGLIYKDTKNGFRVFSDVSEAQQFDWVDMKLLKPITWVEFIYLLNYKEWNRYPATNTRYPISGAGSIFPSFAFCKTTVNSEVRYELDDDGNIIEENKAIVFPILENATFVDSLAIDPSRLAGAGADMDGDMTSFFAVYSEEAIEEINNHLNSANAYISPGRGFINSPYTDPVKRVIINITGD